MLSIQLYRFHPSWKQHDYFYQYQYQHPTYRTPQQKEFRLGDHSTNKHHYLVLNTERSHVATNIQLIRGKLIRERDPSFKYEQSHSRRCRLMYHSIQHFVENGIPKLEKNQRSFIENPFNLGEWIKEVK